MSAALRPGALGGTAASTLRLYRLSVPAHALTAVVFVRPRAALAGVGHAAFARCAAMEWAVCGTLALPAPPPGPAAAPQPDPCCASHPSEPLAALAHGCRVSVFDTLSGARSVDATLPAAALALVFSPAHAASGLPCLLLAALADGQLVAVGLRTGSVLGLGERAPAGKGASAGRPPFLVPLRGAARPLLLLGAPGRSALRLLDLGACLAGGAGGEARALRLRTEHKRPLSALAAHASEPLAYAAYAESGALRCYALQAGSASAPLRGSQRAEAAEGEASARGGGGAHATALALLPPCAPDAAPLLLSADSGGRLAGWALGGGGEPRPFAACGLQGAAEAGRLRCSALLPLPALGGFAALAGEGDAHQLRCYFAPAAAAGGGLQRVGGGGAGALRLPRPAHARALLPPGARCLTAAALPAPGAGGALLALLAAPPGAPPRLLLLAPRARAGGPSAQLPTPPPLACEPLLARAQPPQLPPALPFLCGGRLGCHWAAEGRSRELLPLPPGLGLPVRLARCAAADAALLLLAPAAGAPPAAACLLWGWAEGGCALSPPRPARDAAFVGPDGGLVAVLSPAGGALQLFTLDALRAGGPAAAQAQLAPTAQRLFADTAAALGGGALGAQSVLYCGEGAFGRISLRALAAAGASACAPRPLLRLRPGEAVSQALWQRVGHAPVLAALSCRRLLILDPGLRPLLSCEGAGGRPPASALWAGPALLFTAAGAAWQLCWRGRAHLVASLEAGEGGCEPQLLAAAPDRLYLLQAGAEGAPPAQSLRVRAARLALPLLRAAAQLAEAGRLPLPAREALAAAAEAAGAAPPPGAPPPPAPLLRALCDAGCGGLAASLAAEPAARARAALGARDARGARDALAAAHRARAAAAAAAGAPCAPPPPASALRAAAEEALAAGLRGGWAEAAAGPALAWQAALLLRSSEGALAAVAAACAHLQAPPEQLLGALEASGAATLDALGLAHWRPALRARLQAGAAAAAEAEAPPPEPPWTLPREPRAAEAGGEPLPPLPRGAGSPAGALLEAAAELARAAPPAGAALLAALAAGVEDSFAAETARGGGGGGAYGGAYAGGFAGFGGASAASSLRSVSASRPSSALGMAEAWEARAGSRPASAMGAHEERPAPRPPSASASSAAGGEGDASSSDDERPAAKPRIVVAIRAAEGAPGLRRPLPPPSTRGAALLAAAAEGAPPPSSRFGARPDPFALAAVASGAGDPFAASPFRAAGGEAEDNPF